MPDEILAHPLHPDEHNAVVIETSGEFNEYVLLSYDEGTPPMHPGLSTVILSRVEAVRLVLELDRWLMQ